MKPAPSPLPWAALLAGLLAPGGSARAEVLLSIYPLQADAVDEDEAAELDQLLRHEGALLPGVVLHSRDKTRRAIERVAAAHGDCHGRLRCLVEVGEICGDQLLLFGSAARSGAGYHLDLKAIEVDKEKILRRAEARLAGDAALLASAARDLLLRLVLPDQVTGTLVVRTLVPGARVLLDGIEVGITPLAPLTGLEPRLYTVQVLLEGVLPLRENVQVQQATTTTVDVAVGGERLTASVEQRSHLERGPPPTVAHKLAQRLQRPPQPPAATRSPTALAAEEAVADEPQEPGPPVDAADGDGGASPLTIGGLALLATGAAVGLLGGVGVAIWGFGYAGAAQHLDPSGAVNDPDAFDRAKDDEPLYVGVGTLGGIAASVGLAVLASGIGLVLWEQSGETPSDGAQVDGE